MLASVFILCWTPPHSCHCHCCCCCQLEVTLMLILILILMLMLFVNVCACAVWHVNVRATQSLAHRLIRFSPVHYSFRVFPCVVYTYVFTINFSSVCRAADATYITKVPMTINHIVNMLSPSSTSPSPRPLLHAALLSIALSPCRFSLRGSIEKLHSFYLCSSHVTKTVDATEVHARILVSDGVVTNTIGATLSHTVPLG